VKNTTKAIKGPTRLLASLARHLKDQRGEKVNVSNTPQSFNATSGDGAAKKRKGKVVRTDWTGKKDYNSSSIIAQWKKSTREGKNAKGNVSERVSAPRKT